MTGEQAAQPLDDSVTKRVTAQVQVLHMAASSHKIQGPNNAPLLQTV
eukprot:CAMPEP_0115328550 /NCGR_PEP_ID=MMETSP0270-20121206/84743_1 /TAXON_ID=71861 /ORGANISM="Scrippsiella trochoidea, Strain CCMP3099" /LENGTH=46 /DNA_ID= /DNA_START= /DNA_END= /DNA_ORIENTATION=